LLNLRKSNDWRNKDMTTILTVFEFEHYEVRFVGTADDPWWVAADICKILEYSDTSMAVKKLDSDEKDIRIVDTLRGDQEMLCINESGLYSLILTSRKARAKRFKKWVTSEVLPAIRKTGEYKFSYGTSSPDFNLEPFDLLTIRQISELFDVIFTGIDPDVVADVKLKTIARYYPKLEMATKMASAVLRGYPVEVFYTISELITLFDDFADIILDLIKNPMISFHEDDRPEVKHRAEVKLAELIAADVDAIRNSETLQELLDVAIDVTQRIPIVVEPSPDSKGFED
jgi:hypothetical protein